MSSGESPGSPAAALYILSRLQSGWRPTHCDLEDAPVINRWRIGAEGPYLLRGVIDGHHTSGLLYALDAAAGWARLIDRWVRLGAPALPRQPVPESDAVMRCAFIALMFDGRPDIGAAARALADRARDSGLDLAGYLLDMAALEADAARWPERLAHLGDDAAALHRRGSERKARRARLRSF